MHQGSAGAKAPGSIKKGFTMKKDELIKLVLENEKLQKKLV